MAKGEFFDVVPRNPSDPDDLKAAEMAVKVLDHMAPRVKEWQREAFSRALDETSGGWPSSQKILWHFEQIAREGLDDYRLRRAK